MRLNRETGAALLGLWFLQPGGGTVATAVLQGGPLTPELVGSVRLKDAPGGTQVTVQVTGLPPFQAAKGDHPPIGPHGNHIGDFPVLVSNGGRAEIRFFTSQFRPADVIGKTIIIHENPDDYRSQPTGAAGRRLACGVIR